MSPSRTRPTKAARHQFTDLPSRLPTQHPRLYIGPNELARLSQPPDSELLTITHRQVVKDAAFWRKARAVDYPRDKHNSLLTRARRTQHCIVTLLIRYLQTRDVSYRTAALRHVRAMGRWPYWSWITWRRRERDYKAIFDLSYGENSATLAIAYDLLHGELSDSERSMFLDIARERSLEPFLHVTTPGVKAGGPRWFGSANSNWNSVCAGGAGMLALAIYDDLPQGRQVLIRVEQSLEPYLRMLVEGDGAWPEGIGYWNYGMRYAFMYLLSHESATGRTRALLRSKGVNEALRFPMAFSPNGVACSFGDSNHWNPLPFHYAVADRLNARDIISILDAFPHRRDSGTMMWPTDAEMLVLRPRRQQAPRRTTQRTLHLYRDQQWGFVADAMPQPNLYVAVRGGKTDVPHGHRDLTSYHLVVGDEALVPNLGVREYLDTTFGPRRWELFETIPPSKNVVLVNGVGITGHTQVKTSLLRHGAWRGFRIDATAAMGGHQYGATTRFYGRVIAMLADRAVLVLDHLKSNSPMRVESRFHTPADVTLSHDRASLQGKRQKLTAHFACSEPAGLACADDALTMPEQKSRVIRWYPTKFQSQITMATLFIPGGRRGHVKLSCDARHIRVHGTAAGTAFSLNLTRRLRPGAARRSR